MQIRDIRWFAVWFVCVLLLLGWWVRMERADTARYAEIERIRAAQSAPNDRALREAIMHPKTDSEWFEPWFTPPPASASSRQPALPGH